MSEEQLIPTPGVFGETGNFLLERELGRGGMGGVYMGRDKMLDRPVAVKVMLPEYGSDAEFVEKFKREAQAVARLIHPNIAQVYSYGIANGMPYIAMELVAGGSLDGLMKTKGANIDVPRVMKICEQVAQALRCAADQGLVHGDVKPENILLDANGNAKLVDFGLAAMQKDTDEIWGTPYYIAPEKVKKQPVDYRADMYSLGGTIYHALTGVAPFEGDDAVAVVRKRFEGMPKPPSALRPELSPQIDALVMKMLALEPQDRFPSFEALLEEYKAVMAHGLNRTSQISSTGSIPPLAAGEGADGHSATGGKKIVLRKKGGFKVKTKPANASGDGENAPPEGGEAPAKKYDDDEEEGGNVGLKVLGVVAGVIAAIGLVVGGLVWYKVADAKSREREKQAEIAAGVDTARRSMTKSRSAALSLADSFDEFAKQALVMLREPTDRMTAMLNARYSPDTYPAIDPGPTPELLAAIASTNEAAKASAAPANVPPDAAQAAGAVQAAVQQAGAQLVAAVAGAVANIPKFREPTEAEKDPMSPEGQKYAEEAKKWVEEQQAKAAAAAQQAQAQPAQEAAESADKGAEQASDKPRPSETVLSNLNDMNALWVKAYGCIAASIEVRRQVTLFVKDIDVALAELDKVPSIEDDDVRLAKMRELAEKASGFAARYDEIKGAKIVLDAEKSRGYIKSRTEGDRSIVKKLEQQLRREKIEIDRINAQKAKEEEELRRKKEAAEKRAARVKEETTIARERFEAVVASGKLRQLDWNGAKAMLNQVSMEMTLPEGENELKKQIHKVEAMKLAQDVLIRNMKDFKFTSGKLRNFVVEKSTAKEISLVRPNGSKAPPLTWMKFYSSNHGNLSELVNKFIRHGREVGNPKLNLRDWSDAMMGMALTIHIVCADNPTATKFSEALIKEAAKGFNNGIPLYKETFPDVDFSEIEAEAAE